MWWGLDAGKYFWRSGREECFSLDIPSPKTELHSLGLDDLKAESGSFLSKQLKLLPAISLVVVPRSFVHVLLTILQHAIDESSEAVGHGGDGLWSTQLGA